MFNYYDLIGIPFKDGGRDAAGFDCYGLVMEVYRRNGIDLPEYFAPALDSEAVSNQISQAKTLDIWQRASSTEPPFLSVMAIRFNSPLCNHTGVYIGDGRFIHTRERIGVSIDRIDSPAWRHRIEGFYIYKGSDGA
jgi:cell wall-associated NlpC family hydrolase